MKADPGFGAAVIEFDVEGCLVGLKSEDRRGLFGAVGVVYGAVLVHGELGSYRSAKIGDVGGDPGREAVRVAVIAALAGVGVFVQGSVEIHFLAFLIF